MYVTEINKTQKSYDFCLIYLVPSSETDTNGKHYGNSQALNNLSEINKTFEFCLLWIWISIKYRPHAFDL